MAAVPQEEGLIGRSEGKPSFRNELSNWVKWGAGWIPAPSYSQNQTDFYDLRKDSTAMRLDKFLKVSRIIKRRTVANEACSGGRVSINGRVAKPPPT